MPNGPGWVLLVAGTVGRDDYQSRSWDYYHLTEADLARTVEALAHHQRRVWLLRVYETIVDAQGRVLQALGMYQP